MNKKILTKKIVAMFVAFITMFSSISFVTADVIWVNPETGEILNPPVQTPVGSPNIRLVEPTVITQRAGTTQTYELMLRNVGTANANNIVVSARIEGDSGAVVSFLDRSNVFNVLARGATRNVTILVDIPESAKSGTHSLRLDYTFIDAEHDVLESSDQIMFRVEADEEDEEDEEIILPNVIASDFNISLDEISAGSTFYITGNITNISTVSATDVTLSASGFSSDTIRLHNTSNNIHVSSIAPNETHNFRFDLKADDLIERGSYELTFTLSYRDDDKNTYDSVYKYFVNVAHGASTDESRAILTTTNIVTPTSTMSVGEDFPITLYIENNGDDVARNIKVTAEPSSDAVVPRSASIKQQTVLEENGQTQFDFTFAPTSSASTMNYTIGFTVEYETGSDTLSREERTHSFTQFVGVNVYNPEEEDEEEEENNSGVPKIIISQYESNPRIVQAGQEFDLTMTFLNTHPTTTVRNIDVVLTVRQETEDQGNIFTPVNSSNSFYIDSIAPRGEASQNLRLYTVPDAAPRNYQITVILNYEDEDANPHTVERIIGINVQQVTRIETSEIVVPSFANVGDPIFLSFTVLNTGRARLNNVRIRVEGEFDTSNTELFIGSFDIGSTEWYDASFTTTTSGTQEGRIIVSYEDDMGEEIELITPFTIEVQEMIFEDHPRGEEDFGHADMDNSMNNNNTTIGVMVGAALAGIAIFIARKKIIKKRREQEFYE